MSVKEHEELQWEASKLMEKRYVRESGSPCAILALFVSKKDGIFGVCALTVVLSIGSGLNIVFLFFTSMTYLINCIMLISFHR